MNFPEERLDVWQQMVKLPPMVGLKEHALLATKVNDRKGHHSGCGLSGDKKCGSIPDCRGIACQVFEVAGRICCGGGL